MADKGDHLVFKNPPLDAEFVHAESGAPIEVLGPLARVNILVGANSSGKSRLLRALATRKQVGLVDGMTLTAIEARITTLARLSSAHLQTRYEFYDGNSTTRASDVSAVFGHAATELQSRLENKNGSERLRNVEKASAMGKFAAGLEAPGLSGFHVPENLRNSMAEVHDIDLLAMQILFTSPPRLLIPAIRSAQTLFQGEGSGDLARVHNDIFAATFRHRYKETSVTRLWTGASLYEDLLQLQCAKRESREKKLVFEKFLGRTFFNGRSVELVAELAAFSPRSGVPPFDGHVNFFLEGAADRELFNVGDGIGALTILLYPLFTAAVGTWAFIEEPELHLHPAYQRVFIESVIHDDDLKERELHIFLTTHSNHLLDVAMEYPDEIAVFSASERDGRKSIRRVQGRDIRVLDALGVRNSSVYLSNCSVWVEGPSDVTYLRAYLSVVMTEKYGASAPFQEDLHFAFLEYGGSLLAHYDFGDVAAEEKLDVAAVANRICVVSDRDDSKDKKHAAWQTRAKNANGALGYELTTGREVENEISAALLARFAKARLKLETLPELDEEVLTADDGIGHILPRLFATAEQKHQQAVQKWCEGSTLSKYWKQEIAKGVAELLRSETLDENAPRSALLGGRARNLAERVLAFIEHHNPPQRKHLDTWETTLPRSG